MTDGATGRHTPPTRSAGRIGRRRIGLVGTVLAAGLASVSAGLAQTPDASHGPAPGAERGATPAAGARTPDLEITDASVRHDAELDLLVFDLVVAGEAGATTPEAGGAFDGAPVIGYVVPTTLPPIAVGFRTEEGTVALAVTSHPDFDDTPLWDESADGDYANDGRLWHVHWTLLVEDDRAPGGLAVREVVDVEAADVLPPTNADVPLFLDSPGFPVALEGDTLRVVVPVPRVGGETGFNFDAAAAALVVNTSDPNRPTLGVTDVYGVLSGDLSLPYEVEEE
jgi:hypothetical protein